MQILNLKLKNFRNYSSLDVNFSSNKNIIIGCNGSGKTNLIEALYVLSLTKSFRGGTDNVIIKENTNHAFIEGQFLDENIKTKYSIELSQTGKKASINRKKVTKLSDYISKINIILFNPEDLNIIKLTPSMRRKLLNIDLSQLDRNYLIEINKYNILLKQRNAYLKTMYINGYSSKEYIDVLTEKLVDTGLNIYQSRKEFIENIDRIINKSYYKIVRKKGLEVKYISEYADLTKKEIIAKYNKYFSKDMMFGKTQLGIHRDDFKFILNKRSIKDYGSEGQQKIAILAFRLSEVEIFKKVKKTYPILILDDLFSEIDKKKINNLMKILVADKYQIFITVTDLDHVDKNIFNNSKVFEVTNGCIKEKRNVKK